MAAQRLVNGRSLTWILSVALLVCGDVLDGCSQPALAQRSPGEQQSPEGQQSPGNPPSPSTGVLIGRVTMPLPPAVDPGNTRPPGPVPGGSLTPVAMARVGITPAGGSHTWWVVTGVQGDFAIRLPAAVYRVTVEAPPGLGVARDLPATVTVTAGQQTRLEINLDTGIR